MTRDTVGVNGIDPVRQGIEKRSIEFPDSPIAIPSQPIEILGALAESLANRANAIRPYGISRHRSASKRNALPRTAALT